MKKAIFLCTLIAFLVTGSNLLADPSVCPPFEGFYIETVTDVTVYGDLQESEDFEWHWNNDSCMGTTNDIQDGLHSRESVARITYSEEFDSFNGLSAGNVSRGDPMSEDPPTTLTKTFTAETHLGDNNVDVEKDIGYQSDGQAGSQADLTEKASLEIVSAGGALGVAANDFAGILALCPWSTIRGNEIWPATNEGIAMGSRFHIPSDIGNGDPGYVTFASDTEVNGTLSPVGMHYDVTADGRGVMEAQMVARLWEGSAAATTLDPTPELNSRATYEEYVQADGIFQFHKGMTYRAQFAAPAITPIDVSILE